MHHGAERETNRLRVQARERTRRPSFRRKTQPCACFSSFYIISASLHGSWVLCSDFVFVMHLSVASCLCVVISRLVVIILCLRSNLCHFVVLSVSFFVVIFCLFVVVMHPHIMFPLCSSSVFLFCPFLLSFYVCDYFCVSLKSYCVCYVVLHVFVVILCL